MRARMLRRCVEGVDVAPDFNYTKPESDTRIEFVHRKLAATAISTSSTIAAIASEQVDATFRVTGKAPELWHAETGKIGAGCPSRIADGRTTVPLKLEPWGTVFVVFRKPTQQTSRTLPAVTETQLADGRGPVEA